jgi:hypothetical protein
MIRQMRSRQLSVLIRCLTSGSVGIVRQRKAGPGESTRIGAAALRSIKSPRRGGKAGTRKRVIRRMAMPRGHDNPVARKDIAVLLSITRVIDPSQPYDAYRTRFGQIPSPAPNLAGASHVPSRRLAGAQSGSPMRCCIEVPSAADPCTRYWGAGARARSQGRIERA